jgi:hypothetical protein
VSISQASLWSLAPAGGRQPDRVVTADLTQLEQRIQDLNL